MKSLSIAMVAPCPFPTPQGTQVFIGQLAGALLGRGHRVHLITYHYGDDRIDDIQNSTSLYRSWPWPFSGKLTSGPSLQKPLLDVFITAKLDWVVRQRGVDLIHAHNYEGALAGLLVSRLRKVPLVFHTHNTMTDELPSYSRSPLGRRIARSLGSFLDHQLPRRADACIAVTPQIVQFICQMGTDAECAWSIPPAIDPSQFERDIHRERPDHPVLLYAGNLDGYQNLPFVFKSFQEVLSQYPDCRLWIVTHSPSQGMAEAAQRLGLDGAVFFIQPKSFEDLRDHLDQCDLALCPRVSPYGFPIKLLNYLAAGKPVVVCRSSAHGIRHGVDGWVVDDGDVHGFAQAILMLLGDERLRERLSANARRTAHQTYSWEALIGQYEEVYLETLSRWHSWPKGN